MYQTQNIRNVIILEKVRLSSNLLYQVNAFNVKLYLGLYTYSIVCILIKCIMNEDEVNSLKDVQCFKRY